MPPPRIFVMSSQAVGPRDDRRPAGLIHAARTAMPPRNRSFCGLVSLFWFGDTDFETVEGERCPTCVAHLAAHPDADPGLDPDA
ncbi:MAG TPA: hypothetical protein VF743_02375 [Acidimicrobiales bacterium]